MTKSKVKDTPQAQDADLYAIDLFCGAGGLTHGLVTEGIPVVAGYDLDPACKFPFEHNNNDAKFIQADLTDVNSTDLLQRWPEGKLRLLAGCAPCQPFSTYSQGRDTSKDAKWKLLYAFGDLIRECQPELVTMENVPQLPKHQVFDDFVATLKDQGYYVHWEVVYCPDYGLPQQRKRLVLLASKLGPIALIFPTHTPENYVTVRDVIKDLPKIAAGETHSTDPLHKASKVNALNMSRLQQSRPGGTWRDWEKNLVAKCHRKKSGKTFPGVYGRMTWEKPAPTMTTLCYGFGNGRFGHPEQDRAISLREAALFQTFPANYQFTSPETPVQMRTVGRLIGNAVPVELGKVVARSIKAHLALYPKAKTYSKKPSKKKSAQKH